MGNKFEIKVLFNTEGKQFNHFYNAFGYANTDYTYTKPGLRMYDYLSSYSGYCCYMRMHNILTSHGKGDYYFLSEGSDYGNPKREGEYTETVDNVISIDNKGNICYNWSTVDKVYDILVQNNIRPIVETVYMPGCLQKSKELWFIPDDFNRWRQVLVEFVVHLQDRYGTEEVEKWYFEVWNEPDSQKLWLEKPETFFALYDYMEDAIHAVNSNIKVGGPATKQWEGAYKLFAQFMEHCSNGINYVTGKFGARLDFISVHCKGGHPEHYNPSTETMFDSLKTYMEILKEYPQYQNTEFFNDESDIVWDGNKGVYYSSWLNFRNTHYAPGFVCKMVNTYCNIVEDEYGKNLSIVDSDNCHIQWEKYLYSGNRSQLTPLVAYGSCDLLKLPIFNAYVLLSRLGDVRYDGVCVQDEFKVKYGVLPTMKNKSISVMVWNFEDGIEDDINHRTINLKLESIPLAGNYKLMHYRIDRDHSSSYHTWQQMGKPENPSFEQIEQIRKKEGLELYEGVKDVTMKSKMEIELYMPMHAVSLLLFVPQTEDKPECITDIKGEVEKGSNGNDQVFLKWNPSPEFDFLYYKISRKKHLEHDYTIISQNISQNTSTYVDMDVEYDQTYHYKVAAVNASLVESDFSLSQEMSVNIK